MQTLNKIKICHCWMKREKNVFSWEQKGYIRMLSQKFVNFTKIYGSKNHQALGGPYLAYVPHMESHRPELTEIKGLFD